MQLRALSIAISRPDASRQLINIILQKLKWSIWIIKNKFNYTRKNTVLLVSKRSIWKFRYKFENNFGPSTLKRWWHCCKRT